MTELCKPARHFSRSFLHCVYLGTRNQAKVVLSFLESGCTRLELRGEVSKRRSLVRSMSVSLKVLSGTKLLIRKWNLSQALIHFKWFFTNKLIKLNSRLIWRVFEPCLRFNRLRRFTLLLRSFI